MSPSLPQELLDLVIDHLHDDPAALKTCCIVSRSCVTPARKRLFAHVEFFTTEPYIEVWKKTFPDPSNSPARYTRSLAIHGAHGNPTVDTGVGGWVRTFHNVTHLKLMLLGRASLILFHGLSRALRSLSLTFLPTEVFDLVCSFPLLEDLLLCILHPENDTYIRNPPPTSPKLTGSLYLEVYGNTRTVTRRLLDLPNGLRFKKINMVFKEGDTGSVVDLVSGCSDALESLTVLYSPSNVPRVVFLDFSKATKLKHLTFSQDGTKSNVQWITMTLQTVDSKDLQSITIKPHDLPPKPVEEGVYQEWRDLDRTLVQFWTSHSIRPKVMYVPWMGQNNLGDGVPILLPELTRRGIVDVVEAPW